MNPRFLLSLLPLSLRERVFYKLLVKRQHRFPGLFASAPLWFAPQLTMKNLVVGDVISGQIAFSGFYEPELSREIVRLSKLGGTLLDVGANLGYFSLLWAGGAPGNRVTAVEASPRNQQALRETLRSNGLADQLTVIDKAAGDENGRVAFNLGPEDQTGWGGIRLVEPGWKSVEVEMIRLDSHFGPDVRFDVMKVDVEGADTLVLKGCEALLARRQIGTIFFEQNRIRMDRLGLRPEEAPALLRRHGYRLESFGGSDDEFVAHAP